jgi:hypothetical protein
MLETISSFRLFSATYNLKQALYLSLEYTISFKICKPENNW